MAAGTGTIWNPPGARGFACFEGTVSNVGGNRRHPPLSTSWASQNRHVAQRSPSRFRLALFSLIVGNWIGAGFVPPEPAGRGVFMRLANALTKTPTSTKKQPRPFPVGA